MCPVFPGGEDVIEKETEIVNRLGLHARAAAKLVHTAGGFQSRITVEKDGEEVDAKSILGVLLLAAGQGSQVTIRCDGTDEADALRAVTDLISNRFDEES
jgi:phosphocarrier protein